MKYALLTILCGFAVSVTPVLAQVAPVPSDKQTYTRMVLYQCFLKLGKTSKEADKLSKQMCCKRDNSYVKALLLINETRYQDALACFDQVPKKSPNAYDCHYWRPICLKALGRKKERLEILKSFAKTNPGGLTPYEYRAFNYKQDKKFAAARHELELARKKFPDHRQELSKEIGNLYFEEGNFTEALKIFELAIEDNPTDADNYSMTANCYLGLRQNERNLDSLIKAVKMDPTNPCRRASLGLGLDHAGRYKEALAEYDCAMKIAPSYPKLHEYKGDCYLNQRDWKSAINEYSIFINEDMKKRDKAQKTAITAPSKPLTQHSTSPPIQVTKFRNCFDSPNNRPIVHSALAWLPEPVMESLHRHRVKIVVAPTVKDYHLSIDKGTKPDNVSLPDKGVDNVEGQFIRSTKTIVIAENGLDAHDTGVDKLRLVLHELGHAYDHSIGSVSDTPTFKLFYAQDLDAMPVSMRNKNEFYQEANQSGCGQVFADIFASRCIDPLCLDPQSKELAQNFPRTYKYMKEILPARQTMN